MSTTSCTDYLDKAPASDINPTDAYTNFRSFQGFTEELYNCVPVITGNTSHNSWNWGEDVYWIPNDTRPFAYRIDQSDKADTKVIFRMYLFISYFRLDYKVISIPRLKRRTVG